MTTWTPALIKRLRGKRTQSEFGALIGVSKNTVWQWEANYAAPDAVGSKRLADLARREKFLSDWNPVGSVSYIGDLHEGSREIAAMFDPVSAPIRQRRR
jgi:transcriptional regulator with XRE-family HTH domain